eukprot:11024455-Ditylum_brightwellii.AAC.2
MAGKKQEGSNKLLKKQCKAHCLPTGCTPVPISDDSNNNKHTCTDCNISPYQDQTFHYQG